MAESIEPMYKGVVGFQASFLASPFHAGTDTSLTVLDASVFPPEPNYVTVRMATKSCLVTVLYTGISGDTLTGITVIEADTAIGLTADYPAGSSVYWSLSKKLLDSIIDNITTLAERESGTMDYTKLTNKPSINSVTLAGNKSLADLGIASAADLANHVTARDNPHQVTKEQLSLENVENTADLDKPVSTATQTALNGKLNLNQGAENAGKVMTVDASGNLIPAAGGISEVAWGSIKGTLNNQEDLKNALDAKVEKIEGKQLSTEDYTTDEKTKLAGVAAGAEVNAIESVKIHGEPLDVTDKSVNIGVASKDGYGAVKIGSGITVSDGVISVSSSGEAGIDAITVNGESVPVVNKVAAIPAATAEKSGAMTPADRTKLDSVTPGAEPNVNADWNADDGDAAVLHKPTINSVQLYGNRTSEDLGIVKNLTQSEYDALSEEEKNNGMIYCVTDAPASGTTYAKLPDKPSINSVTLVGNKTLRELGITEKSTASTVEFSVGCDEDGAYMEIEK